MRRHNGRSGMGALAGIPEPVFILHLMFEAKDKAIYCHSKPVVENACGFGQQWNIAHIGCQAVDKEGQV